MLAGAMTSAFAQGYVRVSDFGAVADDQVDDTEGIQAALDWSRDHGCPIVYFPKGEYRIGKLLFDTENHGIATALHIYSGQTAIFEQGAVLRRTNAEVSHILYTHNDTTAVGYTGCHDIMIIGATVDENASLDTNDTAFNISHGERIQILGCEFYGATHTWHSIEVNSSRNVLIDKCTFRDNMNTEDIQLDAAINAGNLGIADGTVCQDVIIQNCLFDTQGHYAIGNHSTASHHDIVIQNNTFTGGGQEGKYIRFVPHTHSVTETGNVYR